MKDGVTAVPVVDPDRVGLGFFSITKPAHVLALDQTGTDKLRNDRDAAGTLRLIHWNLYRLVGINAGMVRTL